jgi:glycine C-acetyltransferase/8-amino-7-oxononanoate synthase
MREPEPLQQVHSTSVRWRGRTFSSFSGCDYFRLSSHPRVIAALSAAVKEYGVNVAASRLTTGNHVLYQELERALARFFRAEAALLVSTGYAANLVVAQGIAGRFSHAIIDEKSHPSLFDAARFLHCPLRKFKHRSSADLARVVRLCEPGSKILALTDGMFPHDGSVAPLRDYLRVLPSSASVLVDDAHSAGVLGATGKGTLEYHRVSRERIIQTLTLSKAFGSFGGVVLGTKALRRLALEESHLFIGSTPVPLPLAAAALASLKLLRSSPMLRRRLTKNVAHLKTLLRANGCQFADNPGPIISVEPRNSTDLLKLQRRLLAAKIYPPFMKYPGGPSTGYFRFAISSEHTRKQLDALANALSSEKPPE